MVPVQEYIRENIDNRIALEKGGSETTHPSNVRLYVRRYTTFST